MSNPPSAGRSAAQGAMTLERLLALLDAYGAGPERWPSDEREAALALLAESPDARARRDVAARLDAMLDRVPAPPQAPDLLRAFASVGRGHPRRGNTRRWRMIAPALPLAAATVLAWQFSGGPPPAPPSLSITELGAYTMPTDVLLIPPGVDLSGPAPTLGCAESIWGCPLPDLPVGRQSGAHPVRRSPA